MRDLWEISWAARDGDDISADLEKLESMLNKATDDDRAVIVRTLAYRLIHRNDWPTLFAQAESEPDQQLRYQRYLAVQDLMNRVEIAPAVDALRRGLRDQCTYIRERNGQTLAAFYLENEQHQALLDLLNHKNPAVAEGALAATSEAASTRDIGFLADRLHELANREGDNYRIPEGASEALTKHYAARESGALQGLFNSPNRFLRIAAYANSTATEATPEIALPRFRRDVASPDWGIRTAARRELAHYARHRDITALVASLHEELHQYDKQPFNHLGEALMYHYIRQSDRDQMAGLLTAIDPYEPPPAPFQIRSGAFEALLTLAREGRDLNATLALIEHVLTEELLLEVKTTPAEKGQ